MMLIWLHFVGACFVSIIAAWVTGWCHQKGFSDISITDYWQLTKTLFASKLCWNVWWFFWNCSPPEFVHAVSLLKKWMHRNAVMCDPDLKQQQAATALLHNAIIQEFARGVGDPIPVTSASLWIAIVVRQAAVGPAEKWQRHCWGVNHLWNWWQSKLTHNHN